MEGRSIAELNLIVLGSRVKVETYTKTVAPLNRQEFPFKFEGVAEHISMSHLEDFKKAKDRGDGLYEIKIRRLNPKEEGRWRKILGMVNTEAKVDG